MREKKMEKNIVLYSCHPTIVYNFFFDIFSKELFVDKTWWATATVRL